MAPERGDQASVGGVGPEGPAGAAAGAPGPPPPPRDPLDDLSQRVRAAQQAAERVLAEASHQAAEQAGGDHSTTGRRPPPRGFAAREQPGRSSGPGAEAQALLALLDLGRSLVPPELRHAVADLVRELLLVLRALIDWYLERLEQRRRAPVEVEDIPIA